jgi:hypothetical protein
VERVGNGIQLLLIGKNKKSARRDASRLEYAFVFLKINTLREFREVKFLSLSVLPCGLATRHGVSVVTKMLGRQTEGAVIWVQQSTRTYGVL